MLIEAHAIFLVHLVGLAAVQVCVILLADQCFVNETIGVKLMAVQTIADHTSCLTDEIILTALTGEHVDDILRCARCRTIENGFVAVDEPMPLIAVDTEYR